MTAKAKFIWGCIAIVICFLLFNSMLFQSFNPYKWQTPGACMALVYSLFWFCKIFGSYLIQLGIQETETEEEETF